MLLSDIEASPNKILLSNIGTASFTINYSKQVNQIKILAKRRNTFPKTLIITRKPYLLCLASRAFTTL